MEHLDPLLDEVGQFYRASAEFTSAEQHHGKRECVRQLKGQTEEAAQYILATASRTHLVR